MIAESSQTSATRGARPDDPAYQRRLNDAIFDATAYRLETARARLGLVPAPDSDVLALRRRIQGLIGRLDALKFNAAAYQDLPQDEIGPAAGLQRRALDLADFADNLARRLGAPGDDAGLVAEIADDLDAFARLLDSCLRTASDPALR